MQKLSTNRKGQDSLTIVMRSCTVILLACLCAGTMTGCVTLPVFAVEGIKTAASLIRPVARQDGTINLIGARVGDFGAGVWAGKVEKKLTPAEKERQARITAYVEQIETKMLLDEAQRNAPDK